MTALALGNSVASWVLWNSTGGAAVALLVLAVQVLLKNRISARWRYNLWLLVIVRLVVPTLPAVHFHAPQWARADRNSVRVTVLPFASTAVAPVRPTEADVEPSFTVPADLHVVKIESLPGSPTAVAVTDAPAKEAVNYAPIRTKSSAPGATSAPVRARINWRAALVFTWLAGLTLMLLRLAWTTIRLSLSTRRCAPIDDPLITQLLIECCRLMRVSRIPRVLSAPAGSGPALVGMCWPKLLLPRYVVANFDRRELRAILLHELAHLKRRDVAVNYLIAILAAVHWFNPLLWLAFARMRAERELACDEAVLRLTPSGEGRSYGCTILKLLEALCGGGVPAGALGVVQRKGLMHRRIAMIAQFDAGKRKWSGTGVVLSLFLIGAAAVSAVHAQQAPPTANQPPVLTKPGEQAKSDPSQPGIDQARQSIEAAGAQAEPPPPAAWPAPGQPPRPAGPFGAPGAQPPAAGVAPAQSNPFGTPAAQPPSADAIPPMATPQPVPTANLPLAGMGLAPYQIPPGAIVSVEDAAASQANAKTEQKLQHPQSAQFEGVSFRDVLANLADSGGIDIVTDDKAIAEVGIDSTATPITLKVRDPRPLGQVLQLALRLASRDLDYSLVDGVVFVSSRAELERHVITRAYRVGAEGDRNELTNLILNTLGRNQGIQLAYLGDKLIVTAPEPSQRELAKLLALLGDQVSKPNQMGQPGHNLHLNNPSADDRRDSAGPHNLNLNNPSAEELSWAVNDMLPRMQELADQAIATSNKLGPRGQEMQSIAKQLDALGQYLAVIGEQMAKQGREADVARLKAAMDQIKAKLAPLNNEPALNAPASIVPPAAK